jgi:hypothetical protein
VETAMDSDLVTAVVYPPAFVLRVLGGMGMNHF